MAMNTIWMRDPIPRARMHLHTQTLGHCLVHPKTKSRLVKGLKFVFRSDLWWVWKTSLAWESLTLWNKSVCTHFYQPLSLNFKHSYSWVMSLSLGAWSHKKYAVDFCWKLFPSILNLLKNNSINQSRNKSKKAICQLCIPFVPKIISTHCPLWWRD